MNTFAPENGPGRDPFEVVGIPRLDTTITAGRLPEVVALDELANYTRVALYRLSSCTDSEAETMTEMFFDRLTAVLCADGPAGYCEVDGEPALMGDNGPEVVTENQLRHWEWMLSIFNDVATARALVDAVPGSVRQHAEKVLEGENVIAVDFGSNGERDV